MTTVVNNPAPNSDGGGAGFLVGIIVLIGFVVVLLYFGLPALRRMGNGYLNPTAPQINIPDKVDINVNQTK